MEQLFKTIKSKMEELFLKGAGLRITVYPFGNKFKRIEDTIKPTFSIEMVWISIILLHREG